VPKPVHFDGTSAGPADKRADELPRSDRQNISSPSPTLADRHVISDLATDTDDAADLPDHVNPTALAVARGEVDRGIFVDGVGYGSAMIANKIAGVYAAVCQDPSCAERAHSHSNTSVPCIGGKIIGSAIALEIVRVWMATGWLGEGEDGERYARRVNKVKEIDARHLVPLS